ncbi:energy transducer TonB [Sphingomonas sp. PB2P19]|uniref:energy transducer TonB n=1 Tax=Sphingomonas rhamnosi TaxID=3096156 RepID=UPI003FA6CC3A
MYRGLAGVILSVVGTPAGAQLLSVQLSYPPTALRARQEGAVGFEVKLAKDGRVTGCRITQTSGHADLDQATCTQLRATARFKPSVDAEGKSVTSTYASRLRWRIPQPTPVSAPAPQH